MQTTGTAPDVIEILSDDELGRVIGGMSAPTRATLERKVYEKLGMCPCGGSHGN